MKYSVTQINRFGVKINHEGEINPNYEIRKIKIKEISKPIMQKNPRIKRLTARVLELGVL